MKKVFLTCLLLFSLFVPAFAPAEESNTLTVANVRFTAPEGWHFEQVTDNTERCLTDGQTHLYILVKVFEPELYAAASQREWTGDPEADCAVFSPVGEVRTGENRAWTVSNRIGNESVLFGTAFLYWPHVMARVSLKNIMPTLPVDETLPSKEAFLSLIQSLAESAVLTRPEPLLGLWGTKPGDPWDLCLRTLYSNRALPNASFDRETETGGMIDNLVILGETFCLSVDSADSGNGKLLNGMQLSKSIENDADGKEGLRVFFLMLDKLEERFGPITDCVLMNNRELYSQPAGADGLTDRDTIRSFIRSYPYDSLTFRCIWDNVWLRGAWNPNTRESEILICVENGCDQQSYYPPFSTDKTGLQSF